MKITTPTQRNKVKIECDSNDVVIFTIHENNNSLVNEQGEWIDEILKVPLVGLLSSTINLINILKNMPIIEYEIKRFGLVVIYYVYIPKYLVKFI